MRAHDVVRRERRHEHVGVALFQAPHDVHLLQHPARSQLLRQGGREIDGPELAADAPRAQPRNVGVQARITLQPRAVHRGAEARANLPRQVVVTVDHRHLRVETKGAADEGRVEPLGGERCRHSHGDDQDGKRTHRVWRLRARGPKRQRAAVEPPAVVLPPYRPTALPPYRLTALTGTRSPPDRTARPSGPPGTRPPRRRSRAGRRAPPA